MEVCTVEEGKDQKYIYKCIGRAGYLSFLGSRGICGFGSEGSEGSEGSDGGRLSGLFWTLLISTTNLFLSALF